MFCVEKKDTCADAKPKINLMLTYLAYMYLKAELLQSRFTYISVIACSSVADWRVVIKEFYKHICCTTKSKTMWHLQEFAVIFKS